MDFDLTIMLISVYLAAFCASWFFAHDQFCKSTVSQFWLSFTLMIVAMYTILHYIHILGA